METARDECLRVADELELMYKRPPDVIATLRRAAAEILQMEQGHKEWHDWLYAIWMAFLAEGATDDLRHVLKNFSAWMFEKEETVHGHA